MAQLIVLPIGCLTAFLFIMANVLFVAAVIQKDQDKRGHDFLEAIAAFIACFIWMVFTGAVAYVVR